MHYTILNKYILATLFFSIFFLTACEEDSILNNTSNSAIVEGFIYANNTIDSLRITKAINYSSSAEEQEVLDDLSVFIDDGTTTIPLTSIGGGYYQNSTFICQEGQNYELQFEYDGVDVRAETYVPNFKSVALSIDEISLYQITDITGMNLNADIDPIELSWDNSEGDYYYVVIENMEEEPEEIVTLVPPDGREIRRFRFISEPDITSFYVVDARRELEQFGTHRAIVFRVNPEYASLYETTETSSQTITEPPSNITNGLGIFTGISSDTLFFEVNKN